MDALFSYSEIENVICRNTPKYRDFIHIGSIQNAVTMSVETVNELVTEYENEKECMLYLKTMQTLIEQLPDLFGLSIKWHMMCSSSNSSRCITVMQARKNIINNVDMRIVTDGYHEVFSFDGCEFVYFLRYLVLLATNCRYDIGGVYLVSKSLCNIRIFNIIIGNWTDYDYIFAHCVSSSISGYSCFEKNFSNKIDNIIPGISGKRESISDRDFYYFLFENKNNEHTRKYMHVNLLLDDYDRV